MERRQNAAGQCPQSAPLVLLMSPKPRPSFGDSFRGIWGDSFRGIWVVMCTLTCGYVPTTSLLFVPMYINPHMRKGALLLTSA